MDCETIKDLQKIVEYLDNIITRLAQKCVPISPSGGTGGYEDTGGYIGPVGPTDPVVDEEVVGDAIYLSPSGSDSGTGTIASPYFTLNKVWTVVSAGKTVYMRGGTYNYTSQQYLTGKNGTSGNLIKIWNYPGETPVITRTSVWTHDPATNAGIYLSGNYIHFKGLGIYNFAQPAGGGNWMGLFAQNSSNCIFERLNYHACGFPLTLGAGSSDTSTGNLILNSDFHHNYDPYTVGGGNAYGNADGLTINSAHTTSNTVRGCRFWNNSDDGIDLDGFCGEILIDNCWAWSNGYREDGVTAAVDGYGFKLGDTGGDYSGDHLVTIQNCISFHNRYGGYTHNGARCIIYAYNNTAYHNADGLGVYRLGFEFSVNPGDPTHILRNNIAHANQNPSNLQANYANCTEDHNSWDGGYSISDADFVSVIASGMDAARQGDGSLPTINFLHLALGSDMRNTGVDVGIAYNGAAPDLGAFES